MNRQTGCHHKITKRGEVTGKIKLCSKYNLLEARKYDLKIKKKNKCLETFPRIYFYIEKCR